ncbi:MAG: hypothetical protein U9N40_06125 [Euryarchaeota archaeon]|nr:hypothetical protein [Euryarchaeota archaeon]
MADFVQTTNPFGCTSYTEKRVAVDPVARSQEPYDAKIVYENLKTDTVGDVSVQVASVAAPSERLQVLSWLILTSPPLSGAPRHATRQKIPPTAS